MGIPTDIKTDSALLDRLETRVKAQVSPEQLHRQRVAFIYGRLPPERVITIEQIEAVLRERRAGGG